MIIYACNFHSELYTSWYLCVSYRLRYRVGRWVFHPETCRSTYTRLLEAISDTAYSINPSSSHVLHTGGIMINCFWPNIQFSDRFFFRILTAVAECQDKPDDGWLCTARALQRWSNNIFYNFTLVMGVRTILYYVWS